ncbi:MAG TPA: PaaI family thioesterase [Ilumatobacter sp.]|nr:PaaI family thioesterase [Ilumatobacter sp.]
MSEPTDLPFTLADVNAAVAEHFPGNANTCVEIGPTFAVVEYVVQPASIRPGGFVSGPTQFGVIDAALWYLTWAAIGRIELMALTSELSIRYLRPAQGTRVYCRADLEAASRRSVVGTARVWCDDRLDKVTATAQGTYALPLP